MKVQGIAALAAVALAVVACGGGGGGGGSTGAGSSALPTAAPTAAPTTSPATAAPLPAGYLIANLTITVPKGSFASSVRRAQTVGTGTQSIAFTLLQFNGAAVNNASVQAYGLTSTSPGCSVNSSGNLVCSLNIDAPIGSDIFLAQTYTGANGTGTLTGSGAVHLTVAQNAQNSANLSLSGQVASVFLAASAPYLGSQPLSVTRRSAESLTFNSLQFFVIALDSAGNIILNPSVFNTPVYLQLFYPYGGTPDVQLQVVPGSEGGATTSTSANFGFVAVNSPSDTITASLLSVSNAAYYAEINSSIGNGSVLSSPAPYPTPLVGAVSFYVTEPTAPSGVIVLYDPGYGEQPQPGDVTSISLLGTTEHTLTVSEAGFFGSFTLSDPTCAGIATLTLSGSQLDATGIVPGSCAATISDGVGNQIVAPVTVTTTSVTGS